MITTILLMLAAAVAGFVLDFICGFKVLWSNYDLAVRAHREKLLRRANANAQA